MKKQDPKVIKSRLLSIFLEIEADLRRYLKRFLVSNQDIEDVIQDAFIRAHKAEQCQTIQSHKSFLFKITKNLALTEISRKSNQLVSYVEDLDSLTVIDSNADVEHHAYRQQQLSVYVEAIDTLPRQCQRVFVMCKVYGFSHKEISKRLNISISTVEKHLVKGLHRCRLFMKTRNINQEYYGDKAVEYQTLSKSYNE